MVSQAVQKFYRASPKKLSVVLQLIRGADVENAFMILSSVRKRSAPDIAKLLKSAVANAAEKGHSDTESLYIKEVYSVKGPTLKRIRARAQGRASARKKRMSHITIVLEERGL
jgi:large subunit ribosomal protein L22